MAHTSVCMSRMKDPTKSFGQIIAGIDDARDVSHDDLLDSSPFLDGEMQDLDITGTSSGPVSWIIAMAASFSMYNTVRPSLRALSSARTYQRFLAALVQVISA